MMNLINADDLKRRLEIKAIEAKTKDERMKYTEMLRLVNMAPIVEKAVIPVRCSECRDFLGGYCPGFQPDGYCSEGRRQRC